MQQRTIINMGRKLHVNVPTNDGIGPGFPVGQLVMKSQSDKFWYVITCSGSAASAVPYVSQSVLSYFGTSSFYDINYPYQLVGASDGNTYAVYLSGSSPTATLVVSQSAYTGTAYPKPNLILQSITDGNYYIINLQSQTGTIGYTVDSSLKTADNTSITADNGSVTAGISISVNPTPVPPSMVTVW